MGGDGMNGVEAITVCGATITGAGQPGAGAKGEATGQWAMAGACAFSGDGAKPDHPGWMTGPLVAVALI